MKETRSKEALIRLLEEEQATCLVLNQGRILYRSQEDRLKPLLDLLDHPDKLAGLTEGILIDRVIGRAAYVLAWRLGLHDLYTPLVSEMALTFSASEEGDLQFPRIHYLEKVDHIRNERGDGWCPMEWAVRQAKSPAEALDALFQKMNR